LRSLKLEPLDWTGAVQLTGKATPTTLEIVKAGIEAAQSTIVLMTGDDLAKLRPDYGQEPLMPQPRPNVIFEAGWALGMGGAERTILLKFGGLRDLSDIRGLSMVELNNSQQQRDALVQRLRNAGHNIRKNGLHYLDKGIAGDFDLKAEPDEPNPDVLQRGDFTEFIVDSSLSHSVSTLDLEKDMMAYLMSASTPNLKFNYLGVLGAQNWLNLTADPTYGHSELESAFRLHAPEIAEACKLSGQRVDVVSLGPGDGGLDLMLLSAIQKNATVAHYYPLDLSVELLQSAVSRIVRSGAWLKKDFKIKAIHGDFTSLIRYKPIYSFDPAVNFISMIGYTFGNHNEAELLGKLREGMDSGDYLLIDARLHQEGTYTGKKPTKEQATEITRSYSHGLNNSFAFGPVEALTTSDISQTDFHYEVNSRYTAVPNALNIVTYVEGLQTKFRKSGKKLQKRRLDLAVTTVYDEGSLGTWLSDRGFDIAWHRKESRTAFFLLRRTAD
jgi:hypothetical protein